MSENDVAALVFQLRKLADLLNEDRPLSTEHEEELLIADAMMDAAFPSLSPHRDLSVAHARELATALLAFCAAAQRLGFHDPSLEASVEPVSQLAERPFSMN